MLDTLAAKRAPETTRASRSPAATYVYMNTAGVAELRQNLSRYLRRVERGERLVVTGRAAARDPTLPLDGRVAGLRTIAPGV